MLCTTRPAGPPPPATLPTRKPDERHSARFPTPSLRTLAAAAGRCGRARRGRLRGLVLLAATAARTGGAASPVPARCRRGSRRGAPRPGARARHCAAAARPAPGPAPAPAR
ncbi:hypothetical protein G6F46_015306 [Rhizopus delemar]|nr:hypothetical protein G6F46_015306 [Rhizopus delemar]